MHEWLTAIVSKTMVDVLRNVMRTHSPVSPPSLPPLLCRNTKPRVHRVGKKSDPYLLSVLKLLEQQQIQIPENGHPFLLSDCTHLIHESHSLYMSSMLPNIL